MTWYDHATGSVWSQPLGAAIAGPQVGRRLALLPAQFTTWGQWRAAYPHTLLLADGGIPAPPYQGRRPGDGHIVGVVVGGVAVSWPYRAVAERAGGVVGQVGSRVVALRRDESSGAIRAWSGGVEVPVIVAYRRAWEEFYGGNQGALSNCPFVPTKAGTQVLRQRCGIASAGNAGAKGMTPLTPAQPPIQSETYSGVPRAKAVQALHSTPRPAATANT